LFKLRLLDCFMALAGAMCSTPVLGGDDNLEEASWYRPATKDDSSAVMGDERLSRYFTGGAVWRSAKGETTTAGFL
jgi:hypothetical protein